MSILFADVNLHEHYPSSFLGLPVFLNWRQEGKLKVPYYAGGGRHEAFDTEQEARKLVKHRALEDKKMVAIILRSDYDLAALDFDHVLEDGKLKKTKFRQLILELLDEGFLLERSPGGEGLRLIGVTDRKFGQMRVRDPDSNAVMEGWTDKRFITLTGRPFEGSAVKVDRLPDITWVFEEHAREREAGAEAREAIDVSWGEDMKERILDALSFVDPDDRDTWLLVGRSLATLHRDVEEWSDEDEEWAHNTWVEWSAQSDAHDSASDPDKWFELGDSRIDIRSLINLAKSGGWDASWKKEPRAPKKSAFDAFLGVPLEGETVEAAEERADHWKHLRRERQREINRLIGQNEEPDALLTKYISLDKMLDDKVFVGDGSQVASIKSPRQVWPFGDFKNLSSASTMEYQKADGSLGVTEVAKEWLKDPGRKTVDKITFSAGDPIFTRNEVGLMCFNTWRHIKRKKPSRQALASSEAFFDHLRMLWGKDYDFMAMWLAHIEQKPGELPEFAWLHVSKEQGTGRNWLSSVLCRLWPGYVAPSLDPTALTGESFNGAMGGKTLFIIDEFREGGQISYRSAQSFKRNINAKTRTINPKYGRQYEEKNSCRGLIFSNHIDAMPIDEYDRRLWVVEYEGTPKDPDYYTSLYSLLSDKEFIAAIAWRLLNWDIHSFNPGMRPPMNKAKERMIDFTTNPAETVLKKVLEVWPSPIITSEELTRLGLQTKTMRHAVERAGMVSFGRFRASWPTTDTEDGAAPIPSKRVVYLVKNYEKFEKAPRTSRGFVAEIERTLAEREEILDEFSLEGEI